MNACLYELKEHRVSLGVEQVFFWGPDKQINLLDRFLSQMISSLCTTTGAIRGAGGAPTNQSDSCG